MENQLTSLSHKGTTLLRSMSWLQKLPSRKLIQLVQTEPFIKRILDIQVSARLRKTLVGRCQEKWMLWRWTIRGSWAETVNGGPLDWLIYLNSLTTKRSSFITGVLICWTGVLTAKKRRERSMINSAATSSILSSSSKTLSSSMKLWLASLETRSRRILWTIAYWMTKIIWAIPA